MLKFKSGELKNGGAKFYRELAFKLFEHKCSQCGYSTFKQILEVDHKDGNKLNNEPNNLDILCPNCHRVKTYIERGIIEPNMKKKPDVSKAGKVKKVVKKAKSLSMKRKGGAIAAAC